MRAASPLCELSCALLNDSSAQASLLTCSPNLLAASVIHLASSLLRTPIQAPRWWVAFDVEEAALVATCHLLLDMYAAQPREASEVQRTEAQGSAAESHAAQPPAHHAPSSGTAEDCIDDT